MMKKWIVTGGLLLMPFAAMAQEEETRSLGYRIIETVLPVAIIFLLLLVFLRFTMKMTPSYQQRALEHMDRIEQKYDKIIELMGKMIENQK